MFLILLMLLSPPGIWEVQQDKRIEFRIPVEDDEEIRVIVPEGLSDEGRQRAKDILGKVSDVRFGFKAVKENSVLMKKPTDEFYYMWIRGKQIQFHAAGENDALSQARNWWRVTDVSN